MPNTNKQTQPPIPAIIITCAAMAIFVWLFVLATTYGLGIAPDSAGYLERAVIILRDPAGAWASTELGNYSPLGYPALLAGLLATGGGVDGLRWWHLLIGIALTGLVGFLTWISSRRDPLILAAGLGLYLFAWPLLAFSSKMLTEAPFVLLVLGAAALVALFMRKGGWGWLGMAGFLLGLAYVLRYAGIALIPVFLLLAGWFVVRKQGLGWFGFSGLLIATLLIPVINSIRNSMFYGSSTGRMVLLNTITIQKLADLPTSLFMLPGNTPWPWLNFGFNLLLFLGVALYFWQAFKKGRLFASARQENTDLLTLFLLVLALAYIAVVTITILLLDASTPINNRILFPVRVLMLAPSLLGLRHLAGLVTSKIQPSRNGKWTFGLAVLAFLLLGMPEFVPSFSDAVQNGTGYASRQWQEDKVVRASLAAASKGIQVYSNGADAINYLAPEAGVKWIPATKDRVTRQRNPQYKEALDKICEEAKAGKAIIVLFSELEWRTYLPTLADIKEECPGLNMTRYPTGNLLGQ